MKLRIFFTCVLALELVLPAFAGNTSHAEGKVVDVNGDPVSGVKVFAVMSGEGHEGNSNDIKAGALSGEDGTFSITMPPVTKEYTRYWLVAFTPDKWLGWRCGAGDLAPFDSWAGPAPEGGYTITVSKPVAYEGTVVDENGKGIPGAVVKLGEILCKGNDVYTSRTTIEPVVKLTPAISDANGKFRISCVPEGATLDLRASKRGYVSGRYDNPEDGRLIMKRAGSIAGRIVDEQGKPVSYARITAIGGSWINAKCDANGGFVIEGLIPGNYRIVSQSNDKVGKPTNAAVTAGKVTRLPAITATEAVLVSGRVLDAETGKPVKDVLITADGTDYDDPTRQGLSVISWRFSAGKTDDDGSYEIRAMPGDAGISIYSPSPFYLSKYRGNSELLVVPAGGMRNADIKIEKAEVGRGRVVDEHGKALADVTVRAYVNGGEGGKDQATDAKGNYAMPVLKEQEGGT